MPNLPPMTIRLATPDDAAALGLLARGLAESQGDPPDLTGETAFQRDVFGADSVDIVLIAETRGEAAGYAMASSCYESSHVSQGYYVSDLFVAEAFRRRGIARALLTRMASEAKARGARHVWWVAQPENTEALALYRAVANIEEPVVAFGIMGDRFEEMAGEGEA